MKSLKQVFSLVLIAIITLGTARAGQVTGTFATPGGSFVQNATVTFTLSQLAVKTDASQTVTPSTVSCYTSIDGSVVGVPNPLSSPVLSSTSGTMTAGTYYEVLTYWNASGETIVSPEQTIVLSSSQGIQTTSPGLQPAAASGYNIYIGIASGGEVLQAHVTGFATTSIGSLIGGSSPPVSNSTPCNIAFNDTFIPAYTTYRVSAIDSTGSPLPGFPQSYYFQGSTSNLNTMYPASGLSARFPQAIVASPINTTTQSINSNLSLNGHNLLGLGTVTAKVFETIRYADQFLGPDICAQIAAAIADLPAQGGTVDARAFNVSSSLVCTSGTVTIGSATKPVKLLLPPTIIINNAAVVAFNLVKGCIVGDGTSGLGSRIQNNTVNADTLQINGARNCVHDVTAVRGVASAGAAVHLIGTGTTGADHNDLTNVRADCSNSSAGSIGFQWTASSATALVSQNVFSQVYTDECDVDFQLDSSGSQGPTDNWVFGYHVTNTSGGTIGVKVGSTSAVNKFYGGIIAGKGTAISVASGAQFNSFFSPRTETNTVNINNAGTGTSFIDLSVDANTITDTGTCTVIMGGAGNVPFTQKKGCNDFGGLVPNSQRFTSNGTFTIPAGITAVKVTVIAAGGAGGGGSTTTWGTGGGSGGTGIKYLSGLTPGNTITVTVGTGGTGVANATGNTGGDSTIASGTQTITTVTAKGGVGGLSVAGQNPGGAGGAAGTNGDINAGGNPGGINSANSFGGNGAPSSLGGGGNGPASHVAGTAGTAPGAGGSGSSETAAGTSAGGAGADGIVIFEWTN